MLHNPRHGRVGGGGSDDDSPALREPDVVDAHRHGLVAERVRETPAHDRHVEGVDAGDAVALDRAEAAGRAARQAPAEARAAR